MHTYHELACLDDHEFSPLLQACGWPVSGGTFFEDDLVGHCHMAKLLSLELACTQYYYYYS